MSNERYEIRGKIGQGGVGAVYRAYDTQLRREVAIKRVLTEGGYEDSDLATKNLLKEATALSSVQHPHICTVYDAGIDKEGPYVVMELINGKTLDEMVERGTLTFEDFREVAIQSQEAMIAAQDLDLVHRDLKPSNVMVCWLPSGRFQVKLVDFGLAKFSAKPSLQTIDHGDAVFGSIFFMAPEQFERTPLDRRTDMYSLGSMYYYSLAGTYPFNGDSAPQVMASHLQNSVQPLHEVRPDLPRWVCDWVMWHIRRNMNDRPESARVALEKFLADEVAASHSGPILRTGPQLVVPATNTQGIQQTPITANPNNLNTGTAPQPISPPSGLNSLTSTQSIRPVTTITGGTAVQPARPAILTAATVMPTTAATAITPAQSTPGATGVNPQTTLTGAQNTQPVTFTGSEVHKKGPMSKNTKIIIGSVVGAGVLLFSILLVAKLKTNNENEIYNNLIEQVDANSMERIDTSAKEIEVLLNALTDLAGKDRNAIYQRLLLSKSANGDYSPDAMILKYASLDGLAEDSQKSLFIILDKRNNPEIIDGLLEYATAHPDANASQLAISAASKKVVPGNFDAYMSILMNSKNTQVRKATEIALDNIIKESPDTENLATQLINNYDKNVDEANRLSLIRLLGSTGSTKAKEKITSFLQSDGPTLQIAAASAFSKWPNDEPFDVLLDAFDAAETTVKTEIFNNSLKLLSAERSHDSNTASKNWMSLATIAQSPSEKVQIIRKLDKIKDPWVIPILDYFTNDNHDIRTIDFANKAKDNREKK